MLVYIMARWIKLCPVSVARPYGILRSRHYDPAEVEVEYSLWNEKGFVSKLLPMAVFYISV